MTPILPVDGTPRVPDGATPPAKVARELTIVFLTELLQAMRRTVPDSELLPKSPERSVYDGAFDRAVAEAMAVGDPLTLGRSFGGGAGLKVSPQVADNGTGQIVPAPVSRGRTSRPEGEER